MLARQSIETLIPHRPPILMLDEVMELDPGRHATARKRLFAHDACFAGHFPNRSILPGVLIVEACAQLTAVAASSAVPVDEQCAARIDYLASIQHFKFTCPVVPGETLLVEVNLGRRFGGLLQARVGATVEGRPVGQGVLIVTSGTSGEAEGTRQV